jgi:hypothetical protein
MKNFICTADIHIQLKKKIDIGWQEDRYVMLSAKLIELCTANDASLIIAGDLFERSEPSQEELKIAFQFLRTIREAGIETWLVSGNHETISAGVDTFTFLDVGKDLTVDLHYGKYLRLLLPEEETQIDFLNHCDLGVGPMMTDLQYKNSILVTHVRCDFNQFVRAEVDILELCNSYDLTIAGDIHEEFFQELPGGRSLVYTNTPLNKEFQTCNNDSVLLLQVDKNGPKMQRLPMDLPALLQITIEAGDELSALDPRHCYRIAVNGERDALRAFRKPDHPYVLVDKIPTVLEALSERDRETLEAVDDRGLDEDLIVYLGEKGMGESKISRMMSAFKQAA